MINVGNLTSIKGMAGSEIQVYVIYIPIEIWYDNSTVIIYRKVRSKKSTLITEIYMENA